MSRAGISEAGICVLGTRGIFQGCGGYITGPVYGLFGMVY